MKDQTITLGLMIQDIRREGIIKSFKFIHPPSNSNILILHKSNTASIKNAE
jgi:hypothetical protein